MRLIETTWQDIRHGARMLVKNPGFSLVAILSIGIGVGITATMFSVADGLVLRPLPVPRPGEVVTINATSPVDGGRGTGLSYRDYVDLRDRARSFRGLVAHRVLIASFADRADEAAQSRLGYAVSGNLFDVLEVRPAIGRFFRPDEDQAAGRDAVVVLSHETWTQRFGSDPGIVGRSIRLAGQPFTVIGVAPAAFSGLELVLPGAFYVPLAMLPAMGPAEQADALERRDVRMVNVRGRLAPGVSVEEARAEVRQIGAALALAYPDTNANQDLIVRTHLQARRVERGPAAAAVAMLLTLAVTVLLVACANVAGLLTSRAPARAREIAVRLAVGAGRARLVRQLVTETLLIAAAGGALGVALGYGGVLILQLRQVITDIGVRITFSVDGRVLAVALSLAAASTFIAGLIPAWRSARVGDLSGALRNTSAHVDRSRLWGRHALVAGQVALSLVLLTVAVFLYRAFSAELERGPGFRTEHILLVNLNPMLARYDGPRADAFYERLKERVHALPGVTSVGLASFVPLNQDNRDGVTIAPEGHEFPKGTTSVPVLASRVDEGYFETMQVPIVRGRGVRITDTASAPMVAVVNETLAAHYWPGQEAVGKRIRVRDRAWAEVVGVARDGKYNFIGEAPLDFIYLSSAQDPAIRSTLLVASQGDSAALSAPVRQIVRDLDREVPVTGVWTMEDFYRGNAIGLSNVLVRTVGSIGLMGLALAMVGLYGLVAYTVSRRTREIGIRMAIGAQPGSVLGMVLRQGLVLSIAGVLLGVGVTVGINGLLRGMFPTTQGVNAVVYVLVIPALVAVTLLAAYIPARRAAQIDPLIALRQE